MNTFADIKRRLIVGAHLKLTGHRKADFPALGMTRAIAVRQSNAFAFAIDPTKHNGHDLSWHYFQKSANYRVDGPDAFSVVDDGGAVAMSYEFVDPAVDNPATSIAT